MNKISALRIFEFGRLIGNFQSLTPKVTNYKLYNATVNLKDFLVEFNLSKSLSKLEESDKFPTLFDIITKDSKTNPREIANNIILFDLKKEAKKIEEEVFTELSTKFVAYPHSEYLITSELILEPQKLFDNEQIVLKMEKDIRSNFLFFCESYVYGLYTSAVIQILLATENYNIFFYEKIISYEINSLNWGNLIEKTKSKLMEIDSKNKGFNDLIKALNSLKKDYRIEIIHKNKFIFNEEEAYAIFKKCRTVITRMFYILEIRIPEEIPKAIFDI